MRFVVSELSASGCNSEGDILTCLLSCPGFPGFDSFQTAFRQKLSMAGLGIQVNLLKIWLSNLTIFLKNQICQVILVQACLGSHDRWTAGPPNSQTFLNISPKSHTKTILRQLWGKQRRLLVFQVKIRKPDLMLDQNNMCAIWSLSRNVE